jgi:adenylylsulfate kinase-like enzyme
MVDGLRGSGKTTIARELEPELKKRGWCVEVLDGDEIRQNLSKGLGFSREEVGLIEIHKHPRSRKLTTIF